MAIRIANSLKRWRTRLILSVAFSPAIVLASQILYATSATAEEATTTNEEGGTSDSSSTDNPNTDNNASEEVVLEADSSEPTQDSIDELATAVATAGSDIQNAEEELQETKNLETTLESTEEVSQAVVEAEEAVASATVARGSAFSAVSDAQLALMDWNIATNESTQADINKILAEVVLEVEEQELVEATTNKENQEVVVAEADYNKTIAEEELAMAETNASETVTETFKDEEGLHTYSSTDIEVTKYGEPLTEERVDGTFISRAYPQHPFDNSTIQIQHPQDPTVIDFPNVKQISEIGLSTYAKNGDADATVDLFNDEGETSEDTWTIRNGVYPENESTQYVLHETYVSPSGFYIDKVTLPGDSGDWYVVDDIYYKQVTGEVDPAFYEDVETFTNIYIAEESTLQDLVEIESQKIIDKDVASNNVAVATEEAEIAEDEEQQKAVDAEIAFDEAETVVSSMQTSVDNAEVKVSSAKVAVQSIVPEPEPEYTPPPAPPVYEVPTPEPEPEEDLEPEETTEEVEETPADSEDVEQEQNQEESESEQTPELEPKPEESSDSTSADEEENLPPQPSEEPETSQSLEESPEEPNLEKELPQEPTKSEESPSEPPSALENPDSSIEEKVEAIVKELSVGQSVDSQVLINNGITFDDLPPATPVKVREDEDGNEIVIDAKTAAALVVLENPVDLVRTAFEDPAKAVDAVLSIGKDMSEEERRESEQVVVAAVIVSNIANLTMHATNAAIVALPGAGRRRP